MQDGDLPLGASTTPTRSRQSQPATTGISFLIPKSSGCRTSKQVNKFNCLPNTRFSLVAAESNIFSRNGRQSRNVSQGPLQPPVTQCCNKACSCAARIG